MALRLSALRLQRSPSHEFGRLFNHGKEIGVSFRIQGDAAYGITYPRKPSVSDTRKAGRARNYLRVRERLIAPRVRMACIEMLKGVGHSVNNCEIDRFGSQLLAQIAFVQLASRFRIVVNCVKGDDASEKCVTDRNGVCLEIRDSRLDNLAEVVAQLHFVDPIHDHEHPEVAPQVSHLRQVPLRIRVKLPHSAQLSPS
jgi:hypothetical protein